MTVAEREATPEILAAQELEQAARFLDLEPWIVQRLRQPEREVHLNLQVRSDDGRPLMMRAVRVQHTRTHGPCLGPLLFSASLSTADIRALAMQQTWQWSLWGLPFSGATGLIGIDLNDLSERELHELVYAYVRGMRETMGGSDVLSSSPAVPRQVMSWALSALGSNDRASLAAITGKPEALQGIDHDYISGRFVRDFISTIVREEGTELSGKNISVVGFDREAQAIALQLEAAGAHVCAVADSSGAVHRRAGLNIQMLRQHIAEHHVVFGFPEAESVSFDQMVQQPSDVLILCDGETLSLPAAARAILEVNGRVSEGQRSNALVVPEVLAGFGRQFADYLEWRKATCGTFTDLHTLREIRAHIRQTWREVRDFSHEHDFPILESAITLSIARVATAMRSM